MTDRLPHGYTNSTRVDGHRVVKGYLGPDPARRCADEVSALRRMAGVLPVPPVLEVGAEHLVLGRMPGTPGQEVLSRRPEPVLQAVGAMARRLTEVAPGRVHGDFGPQNLLIDPDRLEVTAILDWELAGPGPAIIDIAWPEWILRTHHSELIRHLPALFAGYGHEPPWAERQAAMIGQCERAREFTTRWAGPDSTGTRLWRDRLAATRAFRPDAIQV